jgi:hypothetical protein
VSALGRTRSASSAAVFVVVGCAYERSNGGWIVYFALSHFWTAHAPATSATVPAGVLAVLLGGCNGVPRRPAEVSAGGAGLLAAPAANR